MQQNRNLVIKKSNRQIELEKDYEEYLLPKRIIECSIRIYTLVMGGVTLKRGNRRAMMCKCTYEAYKENGIKKDPIFLSQTFDITLKQLCKSQNDFYARLFVLKKLSEFPKVHFSAIDLLPDIAEHMNYKGTNFEEISSLIDLIYENTDLVRRISPREVTIACIHYHKNLTGDVTKLEHTEKTACIPHTKLVSLINVIDKTLKENN